jgi:hypothetical protein
MSLIFATQLAAVATAVLAVFAIVTGIYAIRAFRKQSQEVSAIERQVKDQQELTQQQAKLLEIQSGQLDLQRRQFDDQLAERRRAQASCVFIWTETRVDERFRERPAPEDVSAKIKNTSGQPVYDLTIGWHKGTAPWGEPDHIPVLMPSGEVTRIRTLPADRPAAVDRTLFGAVARFRDAAGVHWRLRPDGQLDEEPLTE